MIVIMNMILIVKKERKKGKKGKFILINHYDFGTC